MVRRYEAVADVLLGDGWAARWAYDAGLQGRLGTTEHDIVLAGAPGLPEPLRVGFASDLHAGPMTDPRLLEGAVARLIAARPHVVVLGGDFVSLHQRDVGPLCRLLERLRPPLGVFAVLGNHDIHRDAVHVSASLSGIGVRVLRNSCAALPAPFEGVTMAGLDDPVLGEPDAAATFTPTSGVRITVMHSPEGILLLRDVDHAVVFTGHTHGGQVCLPGGTALLLPAGCRRWKSGTFAVARVAGGMIVSRGVGCSGVPIRMSCDPEVHVCVIRSA
jgi:predicted MPP superfamily phosphohydrolase